MCCLLSATESIKYASKLILGDPRRFSFNNKHIPEISWKMFDNKILHLKYLMINFSPGKLLRNNLFSRAVSKSFNKVIDSKTNVFSECFFAILEKCKKN